MNIFVPSAKLVVLKELPFSDYAFPRWQSNAAILLLGILSGVLQVIDAVAPRCAHVSTLVCRRVEHPHHVGWLFGGGACPAWVAEAG